MKIHYLSEKESKKVARLNKKTPPQPEDGYQDIFKEQPYIEESIENNTAYLHLIFVPASLRGQGFGVSMFHNWFNALPENITQIRLVAINGASGCTLAFYKAFGFEHAYTCKEGIDDEHTARILTLGCNGHETEQPKELSKEQEAHYLFGTEQ